MAKKERIKSAYSLQLEANRKILEDIACHWELVVVDVAKLKEWRHADDRPIRYMLIRPCGYPDSMLSEEIRTQHPNREVTFVTRRGFSTGLVGVDLGSLVGEMIPFQTR